MFVTAVCSRFKLYLFCSFKDNTGSSRSSRTRTTRHRIKSTEDDTTQKAEPEKKKNLFGNLSGVIDSEESDNEEQNEEPLPKKKKLKLIESDEESL